MVFVEVCIRDANILPKADIISLIVFFIIIIISFYSVNRFFTVHLLFNFMYLSFLFVLQRAASIVRLSAQISQMAFVLLISIGPGRIVDGRVVSVLVNILHRSFCQFSQFMLAPKHRIIILKLLIIIIIIMMMKIIIIIIVMIIIIIIIIKIIIIIIQEAPRQGGPASSLGATGAYSESMGLSVTISGMTINLNQLQRIEK